MLGRYAWGTVWWHAFQENRPRKVCAAQGAINLAAAAGGLSEPFLFGLLFGCPWFSCEGRGSLQAQETAAQAPRLTALAARVNTRWAEFPQLPMPPYSTQQK